jgi:hypothetical protein
MICVTGVFVSSVQGGFEDVRAAARSGVESFGYQAVMAETSGASPASPQRALLDRVADADVYLLLVGRRYGVTQASGFSATEDELNEARRRGKPILVLRQEGELEPEQEEFLRRATGGWEQGVLYDTFRDATDVGLAVVRALTNLRRLTLVVGRKGEIVAEAAVGGSDAFGGMRVVPERVSAALDAAIAFAESVWELVDPRGEVQEAAVVLAIPVATNKNWGVGRGGNSISMAGSFRMPETAVAPQPPRVVRRQDLRRPETAEQLVPELRRVFADAGALDE